VKRRLRMLFFAFPAALALAAAGGCGGDEGRGNAAGTDSGSGQPAAEQVIRIGWGAEPPSLDPGLATDVTSSNVLLNIMDPLVKLGDDLQPVPSLAESWGVSEDGKTVTFHLRSDGKWTNGDPVTAQGFEWSWKRTLSPELAAGYAYQFYGIVGAAEYNGCAKDCAPLAGKVGIEALDDTTLRVELTSAQPWFVQQVSHHSFLAVHRATVEKFGDRWTEPENIVTNGPFKLESWQHESSIDLVKNEDWRDAASVSLTRAEGRIIVDGTTKVQAFEAGEIDALDGGGLPPDEIGRLKQTPERDLRAARAEARRRGRRHAGRADLLVHVPQHRSAVREGHVRHQPAQPDRPDEGRGAGAVAAETGFSSHHPPGRRAGRAGAPPAAPRHPSFG
jgi:oligopeptide transport system substrate-binding protein